MGIQRSLNNLRQVFLDIAVLVETQGEKIDDIERNVANAGSGALSVVGLTVCSMPSR